jgi:hypothetical protein
MASDAIIKLDQGGINARILAKEAKADFRRVETASRKIPATFSSPEVKRLFVRYFNSMQLNTHFISVMARTKLPHEAVEKVESSLPQQIDKLTTNVNRAIDGAEALCKANGIMSLASYDTDPLAIEVRVISMFGRRYLELMTKVDQLMPMLETLAIDEVIKLRELDIRKAGFKKAIRQVAGAARNFKSGLQRRMNAVPDASKLDENKSPTTSGDGAAALMADGMGNIQTPLANGVADSGTSKPKEEALKLA